MLPVIAAHESWHHRTTISLTRVSACSILELIGYTNMTLDLPLSISTHYYITLVHRLRNMISIIVTGYFS